VVWLDPDSVHARRLAAAAARDSAQAADDSALADADSASADSAASDSAAPPPPRTRRAAADSAASTRRTGGRSAARDSASTRRATGTRTTRADSTASTRRTTARDSSAARRTTARDTSAARRTAARDTAARTGRPRTHTVAAGETLYGIARKYGVTSAQIRALNPDLGETLETGTVLRLPAGARAPGQPAARDSSSATPRRSTAARADSAARRGSTSRADTAARRAQTPARTGGRRTHTVAAHETLFGIARKYGVSVDAIRRANHLEGDALHPGQTLVIPAAPRP
jgi:membrane-bound lytic murein transglycosylase D